MGHCVAAAWAMTPKDTALVVAGWNEAQKAASGEVEAPSLEEYEALVARYG